MTPERQSIVLRRSGRRSQRWSSPRADTGQRQTPGSWFLSPAHCVWERARNCSPRHPPPPTGCLDWREMRTRTHLGCHLVLGLHLGTAEWCNAVVSTPLALLTLSDIRWDAHVEICWVVEQHFRLHSLYIHVHVPSWHQYDQYNAINTFKWDFNKIHSRNDRAKKWKRQARRVCGQVRICAVLFVTNNSLSRKAQYICKLNSLSLDGNGNKGRVHL